MDSVDVVIVGAGAAGMMCAIEAGRRGRKVLVIDHAKAAGEKIRISGGGRCNFTNIHAGPGNFISQNPHFCISALKRYTQHDFLALVKSHGIAFHEKTLGQLFCDGSATQIIALLLGEMKRHGAQLRLNMRVEKIEKEISVANKAADAARQAIEQETREQRERMTALAFKDPARLAPKIAFADARGLLSLPVAGSRLRGFGDPDGAGGTTRGISLETRPGALVSAPSDAWVVYAGPFRSFGQLLILNAGGGYYILLAGMQRIDVTLNQFVLAGEPVAVMGETSEAAATTVGVGTGQPVLYIEFRKDGVSVDPGPWWTKSQGEKVRG